MREMTAACTRETTFRLSSDNSLSPPAGMVLVPASCCLPRQSGVVCPPGQRILSQMTALPQVPVTPRMRVVSETG